MRLDHFRVSEYSKVIQISIYRPRKCWLIGEYLNAMPCELMMLTIGLGIIGSSALFSEPDAS